MVAKGRGRLLGWAESVKAVSWDRPNIIASENNTTGRKITSILMTSQNSLEIKAFANLS